MLQFSGNIELKERRIGIVSVSFCAEKVRFNCRNWWSLLKLLGALRPLKSSGLVKMKLSLSEAVFSVRDREKFCLPVCEEFGWRSVVRQLCKSLLYRSA